MKSSSVSVEHGRNEGRVASSKEEVIIRGKVLEKDRGGEVYRAPSGFSVLKIEMEQRKRATVSGYLTHEGSVAGMTFTFYGSWEEHHKYGKQFQFKRYDAEDPEILFFLSKVVKGIGDKIAREILDRFGEENLVRIIENEPEKLLEIKGIKDKRLDKIRESWNKHKPMRDLAMYLSPYKVSTSTIVRIFNFFGPQAVGLVKDNPYVLSQIHGFGFKSADKVALKTNADPGSPHRIRECVSYVLSKKGDEGDTVVAPEELFEAMSEELTIREGELESLAQGFVPEAKEMALAVEEMAAWGRVVKMDGFFSQKGFYSAEKTILEEIRRRLSLRGAPPVPPRDVDVILTVEERAMGFRFSEEQKDVVRLMASGVNTAALCGYAGTGKSTIVKVVLDVLSSRFGRNQVACMALSGIAADRIRKLTGYKASTIHSALRWNGEKFEVGKDNPLPYRVVVLDESSMVNSFLFCRIVESLRDDAVFLMVGDDAQLPPIGAGDVFADLIAGGVVPTVKLTKIHRTSEKAVITEFANQVRQKLVPQGYKHQGYEDFRFLDRSIEGYWKLKHSLPEKELKELQERNYKEILSDIIAAAERARETMTDPISDFQVLSPMRKLILGSDNLNRELQNVLNPGGGDKVVEMFGTKFKPKDKVVHVRNRDMEYMDFAEYADVGFVDSRVKVMRVLNGNVGIVADIDMEEKKMYVYYPNETDGICVRYDFREIGDIVELAYCLSVHKAQGNEYRRVVVPVSTIHYRMITPQWLYTAITRAKEHITITGQSYMFESGCKRKESGRSKRRTVLSILCPPPSGARRIS